MAASVTKVVIHMYKMGTGDCFVLKFHDGNKVLFKMLIDCGCWTRKMVEVVPFINALHDDVNGHVNVLVVTHEHTDHVYGFEAGKEIFKNITFDEIWMGWSEKDGDPEVEKWKRNYGERKLAIAKAALEIRNRLNSQDYASQYQSSWYKEEILHLHTRFSEVMDEFEALHLSGTYKGGLEGMRLVKEEFATNNIQYLTRGKVLKDIPNLPDVKIFVLGPPELYKSVKKESGEDGESYDHNKDIEADDLLLKAIDYAADSTLCEGFYPFEKQYEFRPDDTHRMKTIYEDVNEKWRQIDFDWLMSSGSLALRMNSLTNNLSLVLAFQIGEKKEVILFPGDAEFGSWQSWHEIDWEAEGENIKTSDLLANTIFYKVAHHLSHNGTAKSIGLDLMTHDYLSSMATLDYNVISSGWKSTMPNKLIVKDLLSKTRGRLMLINPDQLFYDTNDEVPLVDKIAEYRDTMSTADRKRFNDDFDDSNPFYIEYVVRIKR